jgi:ABC-type tungstate transport system substrate-binding protein
MNTFSDSVSTAFALITSFDPLLGSIVFRSLAVSALACLQASRQAWCWARGWAWRGFAAATRC